MLKQVLGLLVGSQLLFAPLLRADSGSVPVFLQELSLQIPRDLVLVSSGKQPGEEQLGVGSQSAPHSPAPSSFAPGPILVARSSARDSGFPTFNIVKAPGAFPAPPKDLAKLSQVLAASYQSVGMFEAKSTAAIFVPSTVEDLPLISLTYRNGPHEMRAAVSVLSFSDRHYVFTWTDQVAEAKDPSALSLQATGVLATLSWKPESAVARMKEPVASLSPASMALLVLCFICFAGVAYLLRRTRFSK